MMLRKRAQFLELERPRAPPQPPMHAHDPKPLGAPSTRDTADSCASYKTNFALHGLPRLSSPTSHFPPRTLFHIFDSTEFITIGMPDLMSHNDSPSNLAIRSNDDSHSGYPHNLSKLVAHRCGIVTPGHQGSGYPPFGRPAHTSDDPPYAAFSGSGIATFGVPHADFTGHCYIPGGYLASPSVAPDFSTPGPNGIPAYPSSAHEGGHSVAYEHPHARAGSNFVPCISATGESNVSVYPPMSPITGVPNGDQARESLGYAAPAAYPDFLGAGAAANNRTIMAGRTLVNYGQSTMPPTLPGIPPSAPQAFTGTDYGMHAPTSFAYPQEFLPPHGGAFRPGPPAVQQVMARNGSTPTHAHRPVTTPPAVPPAAASNTPSASDAPGARCLWGPVRCNVPLFDLTPGGIRRHLKQHHFDQGASWENRRRGGCAWGHGGRPCEKDLNYASFGKHVASIHLRSTLCACRYCAHYFTRRDSLNRHMKACAARGNRH
ncbi:hypothetical protein AcW1_001696 [Taiwanofungus camphoratus]|nr:hypothetical protein AcV7_001554 [Antrodia cinnamomea]KAI0945481.1 hypothetical protein AcW1_001696 [Antrodia cinnamomea]